MLFPSRTKRLKRERRERRFVATRAAPGFSNNKFGLEVELKREFYDPATVLIHDFAEVMKRIAPVVTLTTVRKSEAPSWIASATSGSSSSSIRCIIHRPKAAGIQRKIDVTLTRGVRDAELRRIGLIEQVEESGSKLKLFRLAEVKVLEERDIEIAPVRSPQVERRL